MATLRIQNKLSLYPQSCLIEIGCYDSEILLIRMELLFSDREYELYFPFIFSFFSIRFNYIINTHLVRSINLPSMLKKILLCYKQIIIN